MKGRNIKKKYTKFTLHESEPLNLAQQSLLQNYCPPKQIHKAASLHKAVRNGHLRTVKRLLEEGVDIEAKNPWGATALYVAVTGKHFEIAEFLIENGANVNARTFKYNESPLNVAMYFTDIRFSQLLIESGADVGEKTPSGDRPLHIAAKYYNIELANLLLIHGADIEARSDEGLTPLDIAIRTMNPKIAKVFVWYGANITSENIYNSSVEQPTKWELELQNMLKIALTLDRLLCTQIKYSQEFETESLSLNVLTHSCKDLLFNRVLFKSFRNKKLSLKEFSTITENILISLYNNISNTNAEINIDLFQNLERALNELIGNIAGSSIQNEIGNVPSLFKLSLDTLISNGLWDQKNEEFLPDIIDKINLLGEIEYFMNIMCLMLQPETL